MSRDPSGVYTLPPASDGVTNQTIVSAKYNGVIHDIESDLNTPRPVVAGGTSATSASAARANLQAEVAAQTVTNYDTQVWETGSFKSAPGAINSPDGSGAATNFYVGTVQMYDVNTGVVEARNTATGVMYMRKKLSPAAWGAWTADSGSAAFVQKAGDTMTGDLYISKASPTFVLNKAASGQGSVIYGQNNSNARWAIVLGDSGAESGGNAGSNFSIISYADSPPNTAITSPLSIARSTSLVTVSALSTPGNITAANVTASSELKSTAGVVRLNAAGDRYLSWDGTNYNLSGANAYSAAGRLVGAPEFATSQTATNGYLKIPTAIGQSVILQWGLTGGGTDVVTATFPIAFPYNCIAIGSIAGDVGAPIGTTTLLAYSVSNIGPSSFQFQPRYHTGTSSPAIATQAFRWIALGY